MFRWHVVSAVFWRNVKQYFSGPLGYLFIVVFVTVCAVMAFSPQFFADNLANLDQLSEWFPMLLLFFVPAITMSVWADEKRQGTDSILFTLPASDFDILLGKYLAVSAVYTVAILFSMTQLIVLKIIGSPDWGVVISTYIGYWLSGLALLSIGMFASSLTSSATVAFVLGALLCSVPVLIGKYFSSYVRMEMFGVDWNLQPFTIGLIQLPSVIYFLAVIVFMLYLNLIVISRRHWHRGEQVSLGGQFLIRAVALGFILFAAYFLSNNAISTMYSQADLTEEKLYCLEDATLKTLNKIKEDDRAVTIQAFVSQDVPRKFVESKKQFTGLLRQFADYGGGNVTVRIVEVAQNSDAELEAKESGIEAQEDRSEEFGRTVEQDVFLGATISSSLGDTTIPLIDKDSSIEYELSRAIATTIDKGNQITVGIVDTDAHFGGAMIQGQSVPWIFNETMDELEQQFKIKRIPHSGLAEYVDPIAKLENANAESEDKKTPPNVLIVADPSSLDDAAMTALVQYVEAGNPTLILADPLPFFWAFQNPTQLGVLNAPRQSRVSTQSPYVEILTSSAAPKSANGTAAPLLNAIGVEWDNGAAAWSHYNPNDSFKGAVPEGLGTSWPEYYGPYDKAFVFLRDHANVECFNKSDPISAGLKDMLMFYPGSIRKSVDSQLDFQPLIQTGTESGLTPWDRLTETPSQSVRSIDPRTGQMNVDTQPARSQITNEDLIVIRPAPQTSLDAENHTVAARITGGEKNINVVFVADLDFVSDLTSTQEEKMDGVKLDNLVFLQNAIEILAGNADFVALRNRRTSPRTLVKLETVFESYRSERTKQQEAAEEKMRAELEVEQTKLSEATQEIQSNQSLSFFQKLQRTSQEASDAQRRFDLRKRKLDRNLDAEINKLEAEEESRISNVRNRTQLAAILTAPLPALLLGCFVLWSRYQKEQKNIKPKRRVKEDA